jgi:hypothetical protein
MKTFAMTYLIPCYHIIRFALCRALWRLKYSDIHSLYLFAYSFVGNPFLMAEIVGNVSRSLS